MSAGNVTAEDIIKAAMALGKDAAQGRLDPGDLERTAAAELLALVDVDVPPDSPIAAVQLAAARRALAAGLMPAAEVAEWAALARNRAAEGNPSTDAR